MKLRFWKSGALLLGSLHVVFVVIPLIATGGQGEGQGFLVLFAEFPLVLLLDYVPGGGYFLLESVFVYIAFFSILGTLMYAIVGAVCGALLGLLMRVVRSVRRSTPAMNTKKHLETPNADR